MARKSTAARKRLDKDLEKLKQKLEEYQDLSRKLRESDEPRLVKTQKHRIYGLEISKLKSRIERHGI